MLVCQVKDNRQIATESLQKFHKLPLSNSEVTGPMFTKFLHNVAHFSACDDVKAV